MGQVRTWRKPAVFTLGERGITSLWLFLCRNTRIHSLLLRNSMVRGDASVTPEAIRRSGNGKMAARAVFGALGRRLWQVRSALRGLGGLTGTVTITSDCQVSFFPASAIFISHLDPLFGRRWREKGWFYLEFSQDKTEVNESGQRQERKEE